MMWGGWGGGWAMAVGALMMILTWGAIVLLFVWAIRALSGGGAGQAGTRSGTQPTNSPTDIVKDRYARGEITKEQYDSIRQDLER